MRGLEEKLERLNEKALWWAACVLLYASAAAAVLGVMALAKYLLSDILSFGLGAGAVLAVAAVAGRASKRRKEGA